VALVEAEGVPTKVEPTGKIFPVSNKANDVLQAFLTRLHRSGCQLALEESLVELQQGKSSTDLILTTSKRTLIASRVIITTGGQSYPGSGTTGDGYRWAKEFGHTIVPPRPALVPITTSAPWVKSLSGVTIGDAELRLIDPTTSQSSSKPNILDTSRGSLLFTHFGLSGPVALDISRHVSGHAKPQSLVLLCDFLPGEKQNELDSHLRSQAASEGKKQLASLIPEIIPHRLAAVLLEEAGVSPEKKAGELSNANRFALVQAIKQLPIPVTGTRGFAKAEVTAGGISLNEVDSSTMQSKLVPGLYLAGEVLDLDGPIGGYNFQAAFSTGWLAGISV
jgi:predicted Rossmann fold flavoprotein